MGESRLKFASILVFLSLVVLARTQKQSIVRLSARRVTSNGVSIGIGRPGKGNSIALRACPTSLFSFQPPESNNIYYNQLSYLLGMGSSNSPKSYFTALTAGRGFTESFRVCRFDPTNRNEGPYVYGLEELKGPQVQCRATTALPTPVATTTYPTNYDYDASIRSSVSTTETVSYSAYGYEVLNIPANLNVIWVNQRTFPSFPTMNPAPLSFRTEQGTTVYLARCKIVVDESYDPNYTITIPSLVFPNTFRRSLKVSYKGVDYQCDAEDLEFPVCINSRSGDLPSFSRGDLPSV